MSLCWLNVEAAALKSVRSFANQDKTRVVFDLSGDIRWAQARQKDGRLIVRLKDLSNYQNTPSLQKPSSGCLAGATSVLDGRDVRYILQSQRCGTPKVFMLTPRDGNRDHRLVVDFPHAGGGNNVPTASSSSATTSSTDGKSLKQLESELFIKYSSIGSDGLRSMSPKQAREYDAALVKLRQDCAKKNSVNSRTKSTFVAKSEERETEEVKDTAAPPKAVEVKAVARPFIIAIDPGHGGKDPGAKGKRGVREKDVTLAIAKSLVGYINTDKRLRAVLTRSSDRYVDLDTRSVIARNKKAALLISIHCNSTPSATSARGTEVLLLSSNRAQRENSKVTRTGSSGKLIGGAGKVLSNSRGNPYLEEMVVDMSSQNSRAEGYDLAAEILKSIGSFTKVHKKKPVYASLAVLKAPDIPSLLIETGFLSNRYEEIQLNQPNYQKQMAYRIFLGIRSYYEKNPLNDLKSRIDSDSRGNKALASTATHTVQKGEYLAKIAARYDVSIAELRRMNSLKSDTVHAGQILKVPKK